LVFESFEANQVPIIKLSTETRIQLIEDFEAITGLKARPEDITELEQNYLADELLFREALHSGIHLIDPSTRGSLIEIMRYRITVGISEPSEEELVNYYADNIQRYYTEPNLSFEHLYFSALPTNANSIVAKLRSGELIKGDIFPHGNSFAATSEGMLRGMFGENFLSSLQAIESPQWQGPIDSQYGSHYVRIQKNIPPQLMSFAMARNIIANDYMQTRVDQAVKTRIGTLESKYEINIEP
jgi:hypothetical protein